MGPGTTTAALCEILTTKAGKRASLSEVEIELATAGALGLGVEPIDIVFGAAARQLVDYDPARQEVSLRPKS